MNLAHLHIVLNHIPSLGCIAGLLLLAVAIRTKNDALKKFSFQVLVVVALSLLPTYITGAEAQRYVRKLPARRARADPGARKRCHVDPDWNDDYRHAGLVCSVGIPAVFPREFVNVRSDVAGGDGYCHHDLLYREPWRQSQSSPGNPGGRGCRSGS